MIKDIVVNLTVGAQRDVAADYAMSMARNFGAHLAAVSFCYEMVVPGSVFGSVATSLIQAQRAESEKAAADAARRLRTGRAARRRVVRNAALPRSPGRCGRDVRPDRAPLRSLGRGAGRSPDTPPGRDMIIEAALFQSGRPVVVVPYIQKDGLKLDRVMVCWDGSRNAARAVADAMPILQKAKSVEVVVVIGGHGKTKELPGRRYRASSGAPRPQGRAVGTGGGRHRRPQHHSVPRRRRRHRFHRDGRLRPLALAGIRARRRDPRAC